MGFLGVSFLENFQKKFRVHAIFLDRSGDLNQTTIFFGLMVNKDKSYVNATYIGGDPRVLTFASRIS